MATKTTYYYGHGHERLFAQLYAKAMESHAHTGTYIGEKTVADVWKQVKGKDVTTAELQRIVRESYAEFIAAHCSNKVYGGERERKSAEASMLQALVYAEEGDDWLEAADRLEAEFVSPLSGSY